MKTVRIGTGAGYGGDRIDPAIELVRKGRLDYIVFECLAERTIAIAQKEMKDFPDRGYNELLEARFTRLLPELKQHPVKIISNMGAANPIGAARAVLKLAQEMGIRGLKIAAVTGDDLLHRIDEYSLETILETGEPLSSILDKVMSANAYIGTGGILRALGDGADIVLCGRVSDPALFLAPLMYEFGWNTDDYQMIGRGILAGHLLECGAQVMGGYFADPGVKDVADLWKLGFPIGEVGQDGSIEISKLDDAAGLINRSTVTEQILYEIHDPENYYTPDGIADFSSVRLQEVAENVVRIEGASGKPGTGKLKVSVGYQDCFIGEGEISYGGSGALARAQLAAEIIEKRLEHLGIQYEEFRVDYIGFNSLYGEELSKRLAGACIDTAAHATQGKVCDPGEIRLRIAARAQTREVAQVIGREIESLYLNGPAGGGGVRFGVRDIFSVASIFVPENHPDIRVHYLES